MNVVVPCEYGKDLIENSGDNAWTTFSPYKVYGNFFKRSRADTSAARDRIWLNFELVRALMYVVVLCKKVQVGKDQGKAQSEKDSHSKNRDGKKPN